MEQDARTQRAREQLRELAARSPFESTFRRSALSKEEELVRFVYSRAQHGDAESVLSAINEFGWAHWMMNMGDGAKTAALDAALRQHAPQVVLELGGYCGYSALYMLQRLVPDARVYSIEPHPTCVAVASAIHSYAGVSSGRIQILCGTLSDQLDNLRQRLVRDFPGRQPAALDFVLLDHEKTHYLSDLKLLEQSGLLPVGSVVAADNVIYPGAPDYLAYIRAHPEFSSSFHEGMLEYVEDKHEDLRDGIEVSVRVRASS